MVEDIESIKKSLIDRLRELNPDQVILFGSQAEGNADEDSDIDLYVVTKDPSLPSNYAEKRELVRSVSRHIYDLREKIGMDLLVHTKAMHRLFSQHNSSFARDLKERGERIL